jgi:small subunit ribosomal protein S3
MGQKVNPVSFRMGMSQSWKSKWFSDKNYVQYLKQDVLVRKYLKKRLRDAGISRIEIKRSADEFSIIIFSSRPGIIIGRGGTGIEELKKDLVKKYIKNQKSLKLSIEEVRKPMLSAGIVMQSIVDQIEKRMPYRRVMKKTIERVMEAGAKGVKIKVAGRLNGVEIARRETLGQGRLPLHTLRANIDYSRGAAATTYGAIGVKVWIYKDKDDVEKEGGNSKDDKKGGYRGNRQNRDNRDNRRPNNKFGFNNKK